MVSILPTHKGGNGNRGGLKKRIPNRVRNEMIAAIAEFGGTFMYLFLAFVAAEVADAAAIVENGGQTESEHSISQAPNASTLLYISLAIGFSQTATIWVWYRVSGGLFNPSVTLGLYLVGTIKAVRAVVCFIAQIVASIAATAVVAGITPGDINVSTSLRSNMSVTRGLFLEMLLTAQMVFTVFMLAVEKHKATYLAPVGIGIIIFIVEMAGVYYTGGSLNPARSFGPAVVTGQFDSYHWIYWAGPFLGTFLAYGCYELMKSLDYKTVNPGQDFTDQEDALFQPPDDPESADQVATPNVTIQMAPKVAEQVAQDVLEKLYQGLPEVITKILSSQPQLGFRPSQPSTSAGLDRHDTGASGEVHRSRSRSI